jgi:uncharacterized membrane protein
MGRTTPREDALRDVLLFAAAFLASGVEMVEALTIVLAVGITRGWRSPLWGAAGAMLALAALVAALGPALHTVPIQLLRLTVGFLLLTFGLQWLRKAILRASGLIALPDEDAIFERERNEAALAERDLRFGIDWYSFVLSFKGVLLEGLEVAFIVITFGSTQGDIGLAAAAAGAALALVAVAGVLLRKPLTRVPENTLKFSVGIMLSTFGIYWGAEGTGVSWPGGDFALPGVLGFVTLCSIALVRLARRQLTSLVLDTQR